LLLAGLDKKNQELIYMRYGEDLDGTLELKPSLLKKHGMVNMYSRLQDMHMYLFKKHVMDIMVAKKDLSSIREDLLPFLVKISTSKSFARREGIDSILPNSNTSNALRWDLDDPTEYLSGPDVSTPTAVHLLSRGIDKMNLTQLPSNNHQSSTSMTSSNMVPTDDRSNPPVITVSTRVLAFAITLSSERQNLSAEVKAPLDKDRIQTRTSFPCSSQPTYCVRANSLPSWVEMNRYLARLSPAPVASDRSQQVQIGESMVGEGTQFGEKCLVKKSVIGAHCMLGKGVRIVNSILLDYCVIGDKY
jgi:translation initiation factor eIF-2B subunit gamma